MTKLQKIVIGGLLLFVALLIYTEATKQQPVSWFPSYSRLDKIPYGTYVIHDLLNEALDEQFNETNRPPFEVLSDTAQQGTYFFVNNWLGFDDDETNKLLSWTEKGNTLFLSADGFNETLLDTLLLEMDIEYGLDNFETEPVLELVNPNVQSETPYHIEKDLTIRYFSSIDTVNQMVLGVVDAYNDTLKVADPKPNFVKAPFGEGTIYLHSQPEIFTNYFLLENHNVTYTEGVLAYIDDSQPFYWDNYYKSGKPIQTNPLYIILNNKYLKWAYYSMLFGALLFVLFEGKRKQRKIPIVKPPENKTFEYTRTISGMYWDQKDYKGIAEKQILLFMEYIRTRLRIPTETVNKRFMASVAARSGNTEEDTKTLFALIENIQPREQITAQELSQLHTKITTYKLKTDGKS
ncbi:MAG: DUF4350 domain-containing protein [Marinirhabdus sp.]|nr:DUF4350 domain-containing protein [Marinirhabdus sp.]